MSHDAFAVYEFEFLRPFIENLEFLKFLFRKLKFERACKEWNSSTVFQWGEKGGVKRRQRSGIV